MRLDTSLALALPLLLTACVSFGSREHFDTFERASLLRLASFELDCPESDLSVTPLGPGLDQGFGYRTVGIAGCDRRITYEWIHGRWLPTLAGQGAPQPTPEAGEGKSATATELTRFVMDSPDVTVVIGPREPGGPGLGKTSMVIDGSPVWPPQLVEEDRTCSQLVSCCEERLTEDDRFELLCPFAVIRHRDCGAALQTVNRIGVELGRPRAGSCRPL